MPDYVRLEYGGWPLDGSRAIQPDTMTGQVGAWSDAPADDSCNFSTPLSITVSLSSVISTVGLSFYFDTAENSYPPNFTVSAYNGATLIETFTATATGPKCALEHPLSNYNKLVITFPKWNAPHFRARVSQIIFGIIRVFGNKELVDFSVLRQTDPVNANNAASELSFAFDNRDGKFDFENPTGIYEYVMTRMKALPRIGFQGELLPLGTYYLSDWSADQSAEKFTIKALDALSLLDVSYPNTTFAAGATFASIAQSVFSAAGVADYSLDSSLSSLTVSVAASVSNATCRQILSFIATAACLTLHVNNSGTTVIGSLPSTPSGYTVTYSNASKPVGTIDQPLNSVIVKYGTTTDSGGKSVDLIVSASYSTAGREIVIKDNPFIVDSARATAVRDWLATYYQRRRNYQSSWRQNPSIEAGDIIGIQTDYGTPNMQVLSQQLTFSGGGLSGQANGKRE